MPSAQLKIPRYVKQKPHPGEKPSEAFALAPDGLDSGRKLHFRSIDRLVGDNATKSYHLLEFVTFVVIPLSSLLPSAIHIASFPGSHEFGSPTRSWSG